MNRRRVPVAASVWRIGLCPVPTYYYYHCTIPSCLLTYMPTFCRLLKPVRLSVFALLDAVALCHLHSLPCLPPSTCHLPATAPCRRHLPPPAPPATCLPLLTTFCKERRRRERAATRRRARHGYLNALGAACWQAPVCRNAAGSCRRCMQHIYTSATPVIGRARGCGYDAVWFERVPHARRRL